MQPVTTIGVQAIVPGYGFLSESFELAKRCEDEGITFVGPPKVLQLHGQLHIQCSFLQECLSLFGDKVQARGLAIAAGVPVVKGCTELPDAAAARKFVTENGLQLPIILKASRAMFMIMKA